MGRCWQLLYETRIPGPGPGSQAGLTPWKSPQSEGLWAEGRPGSQHLGVGVCLVPYRGEAFGARPLGAESVELCLSAPTPQTT